MGKVCRKIALLLIPLLPLLTKAQFLSWDYHNIITDQRLSGAYPDMVIDPNGKIHISYWNQYEDRLIYAYRAPADTAWTREYVDMAHPNGFRSAIALDANNNPHIAYQENVAWVAQIRYAFRSGGGAWTIEQIPGDPVRGWGDYGPNSVITTKERIKHSLDITLDENQKPQIIFFDGWMELNAFPSCVLGSTYGFRLHQALRLGTNNWIERDFGMIPDVRSSCGTNLVPFPLPTGDRYGEYCELIQRPDNTMQVFCMSRFNNRLLEFHNNLPNTDTLWQVNVLDSLRRMLPNDLWTDRFFTIEGIGVDLDGNGDAHLSYTTSLFYGENFCCISPTNNLYYSKVTADTITYYAFPNGIYRNFTDIKVIGADSIYITYSDLNSLQFMLSVSTDSGATWVDDTIVSGIGVHRSPTEIVGDSLVVLIYEAGHDKLLMGHRHLAGGDWRIEVVNSSENHGASIDAFVHGTSSDTVFTTVFNNNYNGKLFYSSASISNGINFSVSEIDSTGGNVSLVAADRRTNGQTVIAYAAGDSADLKLAYGSPGNWSHVLIDSNSQTQFLDMKISPLDTVHVVYYGGNENCLKYAKGHIGSGLWSYADIDCDSLTVGQYPSLGLDAVGMPHVSYFSLSQRALKYATLNPLTYVWEIDSLHGGTSSAIGKYSSLRLDTAGLPKIAYLDEQSTAIWLAEQKANGIWILTAVDSVPVTNIGRPIDLEIDDFGKVWIAYNYFSNYDKVKLMHRDSIWREVAVSPTGQIAHAFAFRVLGSSLQIFGKKHATQNNGVAMLRAGNGLHVDMDPPTLLSERVHVTQYPNPFAGNTTFALEVNQVSTLEIKVYDLYGGVVGQAMEARKLSIGKHEIPWDAGSLSPGIYFYSLEGKSGRITGKMILSE